MTLGRNRSNSTTNSKAPRPNAAILTVFDRADVVLSRTRVAASFKLTAESARKWLADGGSES